MLLLINFYNFSSHPLFNGFAFFGLLFFGGLILSAPATLGRPVALASRQGTAFPSKPYKKHARPLVSIENIVFHAGGLSFTRRELTVRSSGRGTRLNESDGPILQFSER